MGFYSLYLLNHRIHQLHSKHVPGVQLVSLVDLIYFPCAGDKMISSLNAHSPPLFNFVQLVFVRRICRVHFTGQPYHYLYLPGFPTDDS